MTRFANNRSGYAKLECCQRELALTNRIFRRENIPSRNTIHTSIEEIGGGIMARLGIGKHMFRCGLCIGHPRFAHG